MTQLRSIAAAAAVAILASVVLAPPMLAAPTTGPPTITQNDYSDLLSSAEAKLREEMVDPAITGTPAANILRPDLTCIVRKADSTLIVTNNGWIVADMTDAESETDSDKRADKIDAVISQIDELRGQLSVTASAAAQQANAALSARKILASNVYGSDPVQPPTGIERSLKKFQDWLNKKMAVKGPSVHWPSLSVPPKFWSALLIVLGVLVVGAIGWLVVQLIMARSGKSGRPRPASMLAMTDEEADLVASRSYDKLLDLANHRAGDGDFRAAFRLVYLATLVSLDNAGLVRLNRSRTNWEYLRDLRNGPHRELADLLRPFTVDFDRIWYGFAAAGRPEFDSSVSSYEQVRNAMRLSAAPAAPSPFGSVSLGNVRR